VQIDNCFEPGVQSDDTYVLAEVSRSPQHLNVFLSSTSNIISILSDLSNHEIIIEFESLFLLGDSLFQFVSVLKVELIEKAGYLCELSDLGLLCYFCFLNFFLNLSVRYDFRMFYVYFNPY
jgi:hypothetical protein